MEEVFAYELGKFAGDGAGFPRFGIVNKDPTLIKDTASFLRKFNKEVKLELLFKKDSNTISSIHKSAEGYFKTSVQKKICKTMYGDYAFRVSITDARLYKMARNALDFEAMNTSQLHAFFTGLFDAEGTVDTRNLKAIFSFGIINEKFAYQCVYMLSKKCKSTRMRKLKDELKIEIDLDEFGLIFGKSIRHSEKSSKLEGKCISASDVPYIEALLNNPNSASNLSVLLGCHKDSARRALRDLYRNKFVKRTGKGTKLSPFVYFLAEKTILFLNAS